MIAANNRYDRVDVILLHLYNNFFVERNVQEHFYLPDLFGVMRRFQQDLFDSVDDGHQVILKHMRVYRPFAFVG